MKIKAILLFASVIFSSRLLAQTTIVKPMAEKTVVPHKITWSNIVLSQDSRTRELLFDKNFNPL